MSSPNVFIGDPFTRISPQKAHEILGSGRANVIDIRGQLMCYGYYGIFSLRAADSFVKRGFNHVYSIDGGWEEWKALHG